MRALVGIAVAAALLVVGGLPAIALVLDDGGARDGYGHLRGPGSVHGQGYGRDRDGDDDAGRLPGMHGPGLMHGPMSPAARRCLRAVPDPESSGRSGANGPAGGDSRDGVPQWREKNLRTFAHCLRLLRPGPPPGSQG